jgi:putative protease
MPINAGDGLCFIAGDGIIGTNVNRVEGNIVEPNRIDGIKAGMEVYRNYDHRFTQSVERGKIRRTIGAECVLTIAERRISVRFTDVEGNGVEVMRDVMLERSKSEDKMRAVAVEQMTKSGDSIFRITDVVVEGAEWFATAKLLAELRREALALLASQRAEMTIPHDIRSDSGEARYPERRLSPQHNVVNSLSRKFYHKHGVEHIVEGLDSWASTRGERVMESSYCIRREIGECLKRGSKLRDRLFIEHGRHRYRLDFDCTKCRMSLIDCSEQENTNRR